ncbi:S8 family serine peptidase [Streptomyces violascens]|uniref:S8 family serine peptidase n=1 Tax=Streptomyces violascens TaxID=67381 RepID=UPI0036CC0CF7
MADAHVWVIGSAATSHAVTDSEGRTSLVLTADTPATIQAVQIRPVSGYWPAWIDYPYLSDADQGEVVVEVQALSETFEHFPDRPLTGWGLQAMRLHQIPEAYRGHGIKIALVGSGVDVAHPDLKDTVQGGYDYTAPGEDTWRTDATGHGTHCAGIIAAADNRTGITGIASDAQLYSLKLFPRGRISDLLQALDYCITHDIDLAQLNLAYRRPSQLTAWKLLDASAAGIAVIAPAGDTGGPTVLPASLPTVLAVGALANTGTEPAISPRQTDDPARHGPYTPTFTPTGPGVDLVAPGVAVITTAQNDAYAPADGTAIAAAHITGLAALLLAYHAYPRTSARVRHLHALLHTACRPIPALDTGRVGAGLPDAPTAFRFPAPSSPSPNQLIGQLQGSSRPS